MITSLTIGTRPISFNFKKADIMKIDENKGEIILADSFSRIYKDTIDDKDPATADISFENSFATLRQVFMPYQTGLVGAEVAVNYTATDGTVTPLLDYIKAQIASNVDFTISVNGLAESVSDSKIIVSAPVTAEV